MKIILVFGGNGFIGAEIVSKLVESQTQYVVTLVNRGKSWEWDWFEKIMPKIKYYFKWNRKKKLIDCDGFMKWINKVKYIDIILDFSGYEPKFIEDSISVLSGKVGLYVFISSDSVYEICEKKHDGKTLESDDERPRCKEEQRRLRKKDSYGYKKWKCEHILRTQESIKYVILRLSDVIGQRDTTDRWWQYQLWIKVATHCGIPLYIHERIREQRISLVYVKDVAGIIMKIVCGEIYPEPFTNQAINLACSETPTVEELLLMIAKSLNISPFKPIYCTIDDVLTIYPSVDKGPVDTKKAARLLNWEPMPLEAAVGEVVNFYEYVAKSAQFVKNKQDIQSTLLEDLQDIYDSHQFKLFEIQLSKCLALE